MTGDSAVETCEAGSGPECCPVVRLVKAETSRFFQVAATVQSHFHATKRL